MNAKTLILLALGLILAPQVARCHVVAIYATDDEGEKVEGADVYIGFYQGAEGVGFKGKTNEEGYFQAEHPNAFGAMVTASKNGRYGQKISGLQSGRDHLLEIVLREQKKAIPLYSKRVRLTKLPVHGDWFGYDLGVGDLVAPHGEGRAQDVLFRFRHEFIGYRSTGQKLDRIREQSKRISAAKNEEWSEEHFKLFAGHWDATLEVSFPGQGEGIVIEEDGYLKHGEMKMPHLAPEGGYGSTLEIEESTKTPSCARDDIGYFLRTRVTLDEDGEIQSAHYAKFGGDIRVNARGEIAFTYYFNPTPNDRNLEFDPAQNLFGRLESAERVRDP